MMFYEWLQAKMDEEGLGVRELCRMAGVSSGTISRVLNGTRGPGPVLCQKLARALRVPEILVFVEAGLISPARGAGEATLRELWELIPDLPVEEQRSIVAEARALYEVSQPQTAGTEPANN